MLHTSSVPATRVGLAASMAVTGAAVGMQRLVRGWYTRHTLQGARKAVHAAISDNEDSREKARAAAVRVKRDALRQIDSKIKNIRRRVGELDHTVNSAHTKKASAMRREMAKLRRDLDDLRKSRHEVEHVKILPDPGAELNLGAPLQFVTHVACALVVKTRRTVRDFV